MQKVVQLSSSVIMQAGMLIVIVSALTTIRTACITALSHHYQQQCLTKIHLIMPANASSDEAVN